MRSFSIARAHHLLPSVDPAQWIRTRECEKVRIIWLWLWLCCFSAQAAPVLIFDTGVDAGGNQLGPVNGRQDDPHYTVYRVQRPDLFSAWNQTLLPQPGDDVAFGNVTPAPDLPDPARTIPHDVPPISNAGWVDPGAQNRWIGWDQVSDPGVLHPRGSYYVFTTTFDLTGYFPQTASLTGNWTIQGNGGRASIFLNETFTNVSFSSGLAVGLARPLTPFTISDGSLFLPGLNSLQFVVFNTGPDPNQLRQTGLLVQGMQLDAVPTPELSGESASLALTLLAFCCLLLLERRERLSERPPAGRLARMRRGWL